MSTTDTVSANGIDILPALLVPDPGSAARSLRGPGGNRSPETPAASCRAWTNKVMVVDRGRGAHEVREGGRMGGLGKRSLGEARHGSRDG